jgi:hypothetical protein
MHSLSALTRKNAERRLLYSGSGAAQYFQKKLQDFHMALGFGQVLSPGVKAMASNIDEVIGVLYVF